MPYHRRQFLKTTAGITLGGLASSLSVFPSLAAQQRSKPAVAVLWEDGIGANEISGISRTSLQQSLTAYETTFLSAPETANRLMSGTFDLLLMPHGSHFPLSAYPAIISFLRSGGNLLHLGGTPFSIPRSRTGAGYTDGIRQVNYHKELGITQSFPHEVPKNFTVEPNSDVPIARRLTDAVRCTSVHELYYRFADTNDFPNESGTTGTQDGMLTPIVWMRDEQNERRFAPIVQLDHLRGPFSGGRWILANMEGSISPDAIALLAAQAMSGTVHLSAMPGYACYRKGEVPSISVRLRYPAGNAASVIKGKFILQLRSKENKTVAEQTGMLEGHGGLLSSDVLLDRKKMDGLVPGLYRATVSQTIEIEHLPPVLHTYTTGFWIYDDALMKSGKQFTVDGDYFRRDGKPYPVAGTTYMTSDIHRKFLFEPNAAVWDADFTAMKEAGINMVRTGIWTAWRNYMLDPGTVNEAAMRALDAFLLTARSHDIPVIFTFFAFLPELWNGENAYLDPRSVEAQKDFIALIVRRYSAMNDVMWDLINEPSFCSPQNLWSCRPNYDRHEQHAWNEWLKQRYPAGTGGERENLLRQQYRLRPDESLGLPGPGDFTGSAILYDKRPLKTVDYKFFAQAMFAAWSGIMVETIRRNGNPKQLITVGQDEAGTGDSPSPHFFAHTVDFTSLHNWWLNDDLVWDSVMTKVHGKANLIEETGVMFAEKADGSAFRTEEQAAQLLERKIAISIGTGGAGFIQWIWNINPLMKNDNEATIGLVRADGTVKPEFDIVKKYAGFITAHRSVFEGRKSEEVVMLIPHSQIFSPRNSATEATKRAVRILAYHLGVPVRSVAEHADAAFLTGAKLVVVPAPRTLSDRGWELIMSAAQAGATVLISGIIDDDSYYVRKKRSAGLSLTAASAPVMQEEIVRINGIPHRFSFRGDKIQQLEKADLSPEKEQTITVIPAGKGTIIWSPAPVENSESAESVRDVYSFALNNAGVPLQDHIPGKDPSVLLLTQEFQQHRMTTLVSETNEDRTISLSPEITVTVPAQKAVLVITDKKTGALVGRSDTP